MTMQDQLRSILNRLMNGEGARTDMLGVGIVCYSTPRFHHEGLISAHIVYDTNKWTIGDPKNMPDSDPGMVHVQFRSISNAQLPDDSSHLMGWLRLILKPRTEDAKHYDSPDPVVLDEVKAHTRLRSPTP